MSKHMNLPEIQVRYVLPVIRKELARTLVELGCSQGEAARLLEVTPAAISQYRHDKRAGEIEFPNVLRAELKAVAMKLKVGSTTVLEATMKLLHRKEMMHAICNYHRRKDKSLPDNCDICITQ